MLLVRESRDTEMASPLLQTPIFGKEEAEKNFMKNLFLAKESPPIWINNSITK
jgi:hypothetical protein